MELSSRSSYNGALVTVLIVAGLLAATTVAYWLFLQFGEDRRIERHEFEVIQSEAVVIEYLTSNPRSSFARVYRHLENADVFSDTTGRTDNYELFHDNISWEVAEDREGFEPDDRWESRVAVDVYLDLSVGELLRTEPLKVPIWVYVEDDFGVWSVTKIRVDD